MRKPRTKKPQFRAKGEPLPVAYSVPAVTPLPTPPTVAEMDIDIARMQAEIAKAKGEPIKATASTPKRKVNVSTPNRQKVAVWLDNSTMAQLREWKVTQSLSIADFMRQAINKAVEERKAKS